MKFINDIFNKAPEKMGKFINNLFALPITALLMYLFKESFFSRTSGSEMEYLKSNFNIILASCVVLSSVFVFYKAIKFYNKVPEAKKSFLPTSVIQNKQLESTSRMASIFTYEKWYLFKIIVAAIFITVVVLGLITG